MPNDFISQCFAAEEPFNGLVLDEAIGLGECGKNAGCLPAATTAEAPDDDHQDADANSAQISTIIAQGPKRFCLLTIGTPVGRRNLPLEVAGGVLFWIDVDGINDLHRQFCWRRFYSRRAK